MQDIGSAIKAKREAIQRLQNELEERRRLNEIEQATREQDEVRRQRKEQEARLLELAESGDRIGAVALARQLYAYDLTTAKEFIDSLIRK